MTSANLSATTTSRQKDRSSNLCHRGSIDQTNFAKQASTHEPFGGGITHDRYTQSTSRPEKQRERYMATKRRIVPRPTCDTRVHGRNRKSDSEPTLSFGVAFRISIPSLRQLSPVSKRRSSLPSQISFNHTKRPKSLTCQRIY